jgi:transmembrane sensor
MTSDATAPTPDNVLPFSDHSSIQTQARQWLIRLDSDNPLSPPEEQALRQWLGQSSAHRRELERISAFWHDANILNELYTPAYEQASRRWHRRLASLMQLPSQAWNRGGAIAATVSLAMALVFVLLPADKQASNGIYVSALGEVTKHRLADGSIVRLNTDSQIQVAYSEGTRNIRLLRGEAHFKVASNKDWPFQVYAGSGMAKALGTAFSVRLHPDTVQVTVDEGRVALSAATEPSPLAEMQQLASLARGDSAMLTEHSSQHANQLPSQRHQVTQIPMPELQRKLAWHSGYLVFVGDPLIDVIAEVSRYTTVNINIADPALQQLRVGGRFKVGELEAMFDVLQTSFGIQVSQLDSQHVQLHRAHRAPQQ